MSASPPQIIFGTAGIARFSDADAKETLSILDKHGVTRLDTAFIYEKSEETLKKLGAAKKYTIDSKAPGFAPGALSKQSINDGNAESLRRLGEDSINVYYFHAPDTATPLEESMAAITQLHKQGKFKEFGLSNFRAAQVQEIYDIQKKSNGVLPTVFQGNYNAVARGIEEDLFPLLRKLNIKFNAYSPIAGGFLVKPANIMREGTAKGRWATDTQVGQMYNTMYAKESLISALEEWEEIAADEKISKAALAYRWIAYHSALKNSYGDGIIIGASKTSQLEESLTAIEQGPLSEASVKRIDEVWSKVKDDAPVDNYHSASYKTT